jgi:hypothetical protein
MANVSFNFVIAIIERSLNEKRTYAICLDIRKAFEMPNRDLLLAIGHHKGATMCFWLLVRLLCTNTTGQVTSEGECSAYFPILQGVAQGCPLSPFLFRVRDFLVRELNQAGQLHGTTSADCQDNLAGQAYPESAIALSCSHEGLQHLSTAMQRCLAEDLLL